ncbi:FMN-linked oxidoreductase [Xylona heveae TC161]|uniref:Dihydroorotate dehydrogenase (quinone), mitochondrial n=1 Tax=Xylona heveae (strain CBS 132557 / TC161) TaxID=1328760 RepID=A0A165HBF0_XYLHT|nr:FMN-linked oxidoreductase [Xylona heveae TC161]KZF23253.1 FMN-linked oxidoreductase [Xylona heveae TC161]
MAMGQSLASRPLLRLAGRQSRNCQQLSLRQFHQLRSSRPSIASTRSTASSATRWTATRSASTGAAAAADARSGITRVKNLVLGTTILLFSTAGFYYFTDTRASVHQWLVPRIIRTVLPDAEDAHEYGNKLMKAMWDFGVHIRERASPDNTGELKTEIFGHTISNPIGTSAGLDKNADIPDALFALGAGIVEVGGTTPKPQPGNPSPRLFRIVSQHALINRYGLNSLGADEMARRLRQRVREYAYKHGLGADEEAERLVLNGAAGVPPGSLTAGRLMAVQVAKNKTTPDEDIEAVKADYVYCVDRLAKYADIIVVNVSSPNTPGLRTLQRVEPLTKILTGVVNSARAADRATKPAVMVKVSPDEDSAEQISGICEAIYAAGVDGVIVANTTKARPAALPTGYALPAKEQETMKEQGGYSGPQLFEKSLALVKAYRRALDDHPAKDEKAASKVIFSSGGLTNGQQARELLNAGASAAMLYTALVFGGAGTITRIKKELVEQKQEK